MGTTPSNPQLTANNFVLDYNVNLIRPDKYGMVMQREGPNVASLSLEAKNQILTDFTDCLITANPHLVYQYNGKRQKTTGAFAVIFIIVIFMIIVSFVSGHHILWIVATIVLVSAIIIFCIFGAQLQKIAQQWRQEVLMQLSAKLNDWKTQYPAFTFTIIYPVREYKRSSKNGQTRKKLRAIWCFVRVTQGPCQIGHNETIYATTSAEYYGGQQAKSSASAPLIQQPQVIMVQGSNGQMIAGQSVVQQPVYVVQQPQMIPTQPQTQIAAQPVAAQPAYVVTTQSQQQYAPPAYNTEGEGAITNQ